MPKLPALFAHPCLALLAACGSEGDVEVLAEDQVMTARDDDPMAEGMTQMPVMMDGMAVGRGTILEIEPNGNALVIDHGPIEGMGMDAMAMRFEALADVDLSTFEAGDSVAFAVKMGRDRTARIAGLCDVQARGETCLRDVLAD